MILSKVTIQGFKSFAKKTELKFNGNVTAVVGPNGCGKTNVVDAIRWGLGEQKPSVLRTDRMENVIFGGAQSSRPLGMAEVTIHLNNSSHVLPIDFSEVVVTRRLYRSGDSEYLINKSPVRLKDIQDLLMDTGIGSDAYSVIELKMVEDILSDKAEDRKRLLEEAAGVTKYKHRLKAAVRKLDATHGDLLRVNDIIQEVERTIRSLQRQVSKAQKYREIQEELRSFEVRRGAFLYHLLQNQIKPLKSQIRDLKSRKDGSSSEIAREEAGLEDLRLKLVDEEKTLVKAREIYNETIEGIRGRESDIRVARERISSQEELISRYTQEIAVLEKRLSDQNDHLTVANRNREALQVRITSTGRIFSNKKKELEVFQHGLNLKRLEQNQRKKSIIDCMEQISKLKNEETQSRARIDNSQGRMERLDEEDSGFKSALDAAKTGKKDAEARLKGLYEQQNSILNDIEKQRRSLDGLGNRIEKAREQNYRCQSDIDLLQGRLHFLQNVIESREGLTDGGRKILDEKAPGLMGLLADLVEVAPEHRIALETALGDAAQYLLFHDLESALNSLKILDRKGGGKATLISLDRLEKPETTGKKPALPEGVKVTGWASELVRCSREVMPVVHHLLGDVVVVRDMDDAKEMMAGFKDSTVRIVTMDGRMLTAWGKVQTGFGGNQEEGMVGRKQRVEELKEQTQKLIREKADLESELAGLETDRTRLISEIKQMEEKAGSVSESVVQSEKHLDKCKFEQERADEGLARNGQERQKLLQDIELGRSRLEDLQPRMERLVEERESLEAVSNQLQSDIDRLEEEEKTMEEGVHQLNLTIVRLNGEAKNLEFDINRSQSLIREIENTITQRKQEIADAKTEISRLTNAIEENNEALQDAFIKKENQEKDLSTHEQGYQSMRSDLEEKEKEVRQVRKDREDVSEQLHHLEIQISDLTHQADSLRNRIRETYDTDLSSVKPEENVDLDETEAAMEDLQRRIRNLGAVNLVALEDYNQEKERLDFLTQQREDLLTAEDTLNETIQKINHTARERFREVFNQVRKNFQMTFSQFFVGGEADLRLPENEDPLEAAVEIMARPAGKQLRDLSLLSGGERALTAISLLFALYLVKPSPFCILDEIDAPLDESNVRRFTHVLSEYAKNTQFIMVTHNKMTMKSAQTLYGVTMEEEGVSKIVSVQFEDDKKKSAA